jgi:hypothetical protein
MVQVVSGTADDVRSLRSWLAGEAELRGRTQLVERSVGPGVLGPDLGGLLVDLAAPGAAGALAAVVVAWIRCRHGDVDVTLERSGGEMTVRVSARRVRGLDVEGLRREIEQLSRAVVGSGVDEPA